VVLDFPWLDDEQACLQFGTSRILTLMDGTKVETQTKERWHECLLISSSKIRKLVRKTRRSKGRNAEFYVINVMPAAEQPAEFHNGEELIAEQSNSFHTLIYDDFPELLQLVDSPPVSRTWDYPIETPGPMERHRLN
jgi:hypothetical protein